jgi:hypothetical protein
MELLRTLNTGGRTFLVYIDAEFQTYRVPSQGDPLEAQKYVKTPYDFGMSEGNFGNNKYHFLLNIGFIIIGPYGRSSHFAMFPSYFGSGEGFENPQLLEPGYTTCSPYTDYQITEKRKIIGEKGTFPYYGDFSGTPEKRNAFEQINTIYNSSINHAVMMESYATLAFFLRDIAPKAMIVHKGRNDLYALSNTARLFELDMPKILTRDLDRVKLNLPGLKKNKLDIVQTYFTMPPPLPNNVSKADPVHIRLNKIKYGLITMRETLMEEIRAFFVEKWGEGAGTIAAHNPLVDCVYAAVIDLGLGSSADGAISVYGTDLGAALQSSV